MSSLFFFFKSLVHTLTYTYPYTPSEALLPLKRFFPSKQRSPTPPSQTRFFTAKALFISKQRRLNTAKASSLQKVCAFSLKVWDYEFLGAKVCPFCLKLWAFVFIFPVLLILIRFDDFLIWTHEFLISIVIICISAIILLYYCFASLYCFTMW